MSECATYFETDDILNNCLSADTSKLSCKPFSYDRKYTFITNHPVFFFDTITNGLNSQSISKSNIPGSERKIISENFFEPHNYEVYHVPDNDFKYIQWIQFSNKVNQDFIGYRNKEFKDCVIECFTSSDQFCLNLESCISSDSSTTSINENEIFPGKYKELYMTQIMYYKKLLQQLNRNWTDSNDKQCVLDQVLNSVHLVIDGSFGIQINRIKGIQIIFKDQENIICDNICMSNGKQNDGYNIIFNQDRQICSIEIVLDLPKQLDDFFEITFSVYGNYEKTEILFGGKQISKRNLQDAYHICDSQEYSESHAFIKNAAHFDKIQQLVSDDMCQAIDYFYE